jgi:hypothetical protein
MGDSTFSGGWIFAFLIIAVIFGWGGNGFGGNAGYAGYATMADVNAAINNQSTQQALGAISLSSANNNYETAQLINNQTMSMMNTQNSNLINAIQGFNQVSSNIANGFSNVSAQIADLGYKMENCCCSIKTMMLENRLQDTQIALQNSQTINAINGQSQYLLSQLGSFVPTTAGVL